VLSSKQPSFALLLPSTISRAETRRRALLFLFQGWLANFYCPAVQISNLLIKGQILWWRIKDEYVRLVYLDEGRKRVLLIAACILAARKLTQWDGRNSAASESAISDAIALAERIMAKIDSHWPVRQRRVIDHGRAADVAGRPETESERLHRPGRTVTAPKHGLIQSFPKGMYAVCVRIS
jgi:hypothetical protein